MKGFYGQLCSHDILVSPQHISSVQSCRCMWTISDLLVLLHSRFHIAHLNAVLLLAAAFSMSLTPASTWRIWLILVPFTRILLSLLYIPCEVRIFQVTNPVDLCKAGEVIVYIFNKKKSPKFSSSGLLNLNISCFRHSASLEQDFLVLTVWIRAENIFSPLIQISKKVRTKT